MNWNLPGRLIIILVVGGLANLACLAYLVIGVSEKGTLRAEIKTLSQNVNSLRKTLGDTGQGAELSSNVDIMNRRVKEYRQQMVYDFGELTPEEFSRSPEVVVNDRISQATDEIERMFQSANRSAPSGGLGLPEKPASDATQDQYRKQLRQVHVSKQIIDVLLKSNVTEVKTLKTADLSPDHPVAGRLQNLDEMEMLTDPIGVTFRAPLNTFVSVLDEFQTAPSYLQIFKIKISSGPVSDTQTISGEEPVLDVRLTVAPVYQGKKEKEPAESDETEETVERESESDSGDLFGD